MVYEFGNDVQERLRNILRGVFPYVTYLVHPDSLEPNINSWVVMGRPEKIPIGSIMITINKPEPTEYGDSNVDGSTFDVGTDLQLDLFVSGVSRTDKPRSDLIRRNLISQINRTILNAKKERYFNDLSVKDIKFRHLDNDDPDIITDRHTVYLITIEGEGDI